MKILLFDIEIIWLFAFGSGLTKRKIEWLKPAITKMAIRVTWKFGTALVTTSIRLSNLKTVSTRFKMHVQNGNSTTIHEALKMIDNIFFLCGVCVSTGKTYFFKGKSYWQFVDAKMSVKHRDPKSSAVQWMGCTSIDSNEVYDDNHRQPLVSSGQPRILSNIAMSSLLFAWTLRQLF